MSCSSYIGQSSSTCRESQICWFNGDSGGERAGGIVVSSVCSTSPIYREFTGRVASSTGGREQWESLSQHKPPFVLTCPVDDTLLMVLSWEEIVFFQKKCSKTVSLFVSLSLSLGPRQNELCFYFGERLSSCSGPTPQGESNTSKNMNSNHSCRECKQLSVHSRVHR